MIFIPVVAFFIFSNVNACECVDGKLPDDNSMCPPCLFKCVKGPAVDGCFQEPKTNGACFEFSTKPCDEPKPTPTPKPEPPGPANSGLQTQVGFSGFINGRDAKIVPLAQTFDVETIVNQFRTNTMKYSAKVSGNTYRDIYSSQNFPQFLSYLRYLLQNNPFGNGQVAEPGNKRQYDRLLISQRELAFITALAIADSRYFANNALSINLQKCGAGSKVADSLLAFLFQILLEIKTDRMGGTIGYEHKLIQDNNAKPRTVTLLKSKINVHDTTPTINSRDAPVPDFMSQANSDEFLVDIAGGEIGGGGFCNFANSQDESLMLFYPEIVALVYFGYTGGNSRFAEPSIFFGVRRYLDTISGTTLPDHGVCGGINGDFAGLPSQLGSQSHSTTYMDRKRLEYYGYHFAGIASQCAACIPSKECGSDCPSSMTHECQVNMQMWCPTKTALAMNSDINKWAAFFSPKTWTYDLFFEHIKSIGTGPWGSGVWWGDVQAYFIVVWQASQSIVNKTYILNYYLYKSFCENPGQQCFLLPQPECGWCLKDCGDGQKSASNCGTLSYSNILDIFDNRSSDDLMQSVHNVRSTKDKRLFDQISWLNVKSNFTSI